MRQGERESNSTLLGKRVLKRSVAIASVALLAMLVGGCGEDAPTPVTLLTPGPTPPTTQAIPPTAGVEPAGAATPISSPTPTVSPTVNPTPANETLVNPPKPPVVGNDVPSPNSDGNHDADHQLNRGLELQEQGRLREAIAEYDQAVRLYPQFANAYYNRGLAFDSLGEYQRAIQDYDEAIRLNPQFAEAYYNRGLAFAHLFLYELAFKNFDEAIRLDPSIVEAYAEITAQRSSDPTPPNFKVAFIGDQGLGDNAVAVLQLILDEGADMVLHQGDLDYEDKPAAWIQQIDSVLGPDFPYFVSAGNHDCVQGHDCNGPSYWPAYQAILQERWDAIEGVDCDGKPGWKSACSYKGIFFILTSVPVLALESSRIEHEEFIKEQLARDKSIWRICSWHRTYPLMPKGLATSSGVGWGAYDECRKGGAIIATAHNHTYARTHLMNDFETQSVVDNSNLLTLTRGRSFAFISGLGGHSIHRNIDPEQSAKPWWAVELFEGGNYGALFCAFNENGVGNRAHCYFKDIDGLIRDEFDLESSLYTNFSPKIKSGRPVAAKES